MNSKFKVNTLGENYLILKCINKYLIKITILSGI